MSAVTGSGDGRGRSSGDRGHERDGLCALDLRHHIVVGVPNYVIKKSYKGIADLTHELFAGFHCFSS